MTSTVKRIGGSVAVVIPKAIAREMGLVAGTPIDFAATQNSIVLRVRSKSRSRRKLSQIIKEIRPASYRRQNAEIDTGGPMGGEHW